MRVVPTFSTESSRRPSAAATASASPPKDAETAAGQQLCDAEGQRLAGRVGADRGPLFARQGGEPFVEGVRTSSRASSSVGAHVITPGSSSTVACTQPCSSGSKTTCKSIGTAYFVSPAAGYSRGDLAARARAAPRHPRLRTRPPRIAPRRLAQPQAERPVTVPRHREIPFGTARAICHQLRIPDPPR